MTAKSRSNLQNKVIAVYGASSNIGRKFIQEALKRKAFIIAIARDTTKIVLSSKNGSDNIRIIQADLTNKSEVRNALRGHNVDITINFAVSFSKDLSKAKKVNVLGERYIIEVSKKFGVKRHIYISTIATKMLQSNPYRDTKLQAEKAVKSSGKKLSWIILRYGNVLGTPTWDQPFKFILPFLRLGIPQVPTDAKETPFHFATIDTVVEATLAAIEAKPNQTINVSDGRITIGEYLSAMEKVYKINFSFLPSHLFKFLDLHFGKSIPLIRRYSSTIEFLAHPPDFDNKTMQKELQVSPRDFQSWIKRKDK